MYSATHDSTANYVIDLNMQFSKLLQKVWQEQTRERLVSFIEAVIHFRSQYERLPSLRNKLSNSFRISDGITIPRLAKVRHL